MQQFGDISIEPDKIITPSGQYPLNSSSAVWVRLVPRNEFARWALGSGALAAGIFTGGAALLFVGGPAVAYLTHEIWQVVVSTNGSDFIIREFYGVLFMQKPQEQAEALKTAILAELGQHPRP
ncbi:MAG: hypothetical protein JO117_02165, partial [Verrucomicrobia bacterium]|nr:hypothetical protein [Verrucomicrobiota bacterium]